MEEQTNGFGVLEAEMQGVEKLEWSKAVDGFSCAISELVHQLNMCRRH